ncbi:MAG: hypothetical protein WCP28_21915, partial [Actinomycetes bacterium]
PYTLRWRFQDGQVQCHEVVPFRSEPSSWLPPIAYLPPQIHRRLVSPHLRAIRPLDDVVSIIMADLVPEDGLLLGARYCAAWLDVGADGSSGDPAVLAAALRYEIGRISGYRQIYREVAAEGNVDETALRTSVAILRPKITITW